MIELLFKAGPWIAVALAALFAAITHINAKAKVATANQKVAEAQTTAAQAQTQTAEVRDAEAQANAVAAQAGAQASKERSNAENDIAALSGGAAQQRLRDEWGSPDETAGAGTGGASRNADR